MPWLSTQALKKRIECFEPKCLCVAGREQLWEGGPWVQLSLWTVETSLIQWEVWVSRFTQVIAEGYLLKLFQELSLMGHATLPLLYLFWLYPVGLISSHFFLHTCPQLAGNRASGNHRDAEWIIWKWFLQALGMAFVTSGFGSCEKYEKTHWVGEPKGNLQAYKLCAPCVGQNLQVSFTVHPHPSPTLDKSTYTLVQAGREWFSSQTGLH